MYDNYIPYITGSTIHFCNDETATTKTQFSRFIIMEGREPELTNKDPVSQFRNTLMCFAADDLGSWKFHTIPLL